ncbi:hypothetical protein [Moorella sp. ACPs]|uniref:hypothetical protein n=1 Tax=Neomoorella carbonis TaxID=3062783 RepID=UPI00324D4355
MKPHQENIKHLLELIQANPELRIVPLVDTECVPSDDFNSWVADWGKADIEYIWSNINRERIYIKSEDFDELVEEILDEAESEISEEEARKLVDNYDWEKVIVVRIHAT